MFCSRECTQTRFEKKCEICGKSFYNEPCREKIGRGRYCSKICFNLSMKGRHLTKEHINKILTSRQKSMTKRPKINKICEYCKNKFKVIYKERDRIYCSHKCYSLSLKGKASTRKGMPISDDKKYWTTEKQKLLRDNWPIKSKKEILRLFPSKKWSALLNQINYIKVRKNFKIPKRGKSDVAINARNHEEEIVEQYKQGGSSSEIARKFNVDRELILNLLRKNNIQIRTNAEAQTIHGNKPEIKKANSEQAKRRLYANPEALNKLLENGKKSRKRSISTEKGITVYSKGEQEIANFLDKLKIKYEMNKHLKLGDKLVIPDFWLPELGVYIEYYGYQGAFHYDKITKEKKNHYDERMGIKQEAYKKYNIPVIEITYNDFRVKRIFKILNEQLTTILKKNSFKP
jgi:transposase-like protein